MKFYFVCYICFPNLLHLFSLYITFKNFTYLWVPVNSTNKIFDGCIRDLRFNPCLHQKLIDVLI